MKTTYWLILIAAGAAVGLTVYVRSSGKKSAPAVAPRVAQVRHHVRELELPPPPVTPEAPPVAPAEEETPRPVPDVSPVAVPIPPLPTKPEPPLVPPVIPVSASEPPLPPKLTAPSTPEPIVLSPPEAAPKLPVVGTMPQPSAPSQPIASPMLPSAEGSPSATQPLQPSTPEKSNQIQPSTPEKSNQTPVAPIVPVPMVDEPTASTMPPSPQPLPSPKPLPAPRPVAPEPPAPPTPLPAPVLQPPVSPGEPPRHSTAPAPDWAMNGRFVVLSDNKLIEGSHVRVADNTVVVRQGALDRTFPKSQVQFVGASKDEVYQFMLAKVPADDPVARLKVAQWCMFAGLREQALREAREVMKLKPDYRPATELARSLERSLQEFPPAELPKMTTPVAPVFPTELKPLPPPIPPAVSDTDGELAPEAVKTFPQQIQPFLANQCVGCHAKSDYPGPFKLARVAPDEATPQATRTNLRAVAGQINRANPKASPLLVKSLTAHGGQQQASIDRREAPMYQTLEAWIIFAVGRSRSVAADPVAPAQPTSGATLPPPLAPQGPASPVPSEEEFPSIPELQIPSIPVLPPPAVPPGDARPAPILPSPPPGPPGHDESKPLLPPVVPPPATTAPPVPPVPVPPPTRTMPPEGPGVVQPRPASLPPPPVAKGEFGTRRPAQPPTTGPRGDEFDPEPFNNPPTRR